MKRIGMKPYWTVCLFFVVFILTNVKIFAKVNNFPIYGDMQTPVPACLPVFSKENFKVDSTRLNLYPDGFLGGDSNTLKILCRYLLNDPAGRTSWNKETTFAAKVLNQWNLDPTSFNRYTYSTYQLENLSLVYLLSGHEELGHFIRSHMLQIAELPYEFWLHAELRGYNPNNPKGGLETGSLCATVAIVMSATTDLFSYTEKNLINTALTEKGLNPCLVWFSANQSAVHNWLAVIATGVYAAAKYLNNTNAKNQALTRLVDYVNGSIETDGSYGEGIGYFDYAIKSLFPALFLMDSQERFNVFSNSNLIHSSLWRVFPYIYSSRAAAKSTILQYGDNGYGAPIDSKVGVMLAYIYQDSVALWLLNKFVSTRDLREMLFIFSASSDNPLVPQSPQQAGLPLMKVFNGGDSYIRSTWNENGIVLGMWSGNGSLVNYGHQRPEMGSISLGAFGEHLIVSPGTASYRSTLRYLWDMTTKAANTIVIDDKNQLFPAKGINEWNTVDISGYWVTGNPTAQIVRSESGVMADVLVNQMTASYHVPMQKVRRSVMYLKGQQYFVLIDKIQSQGTTHKYSWRLHLNNRDGSGNLNEISPKHWLFTRPYAKLDIHLFSDRNINTSINQGYMHGPNRDYDPGGPNEGALGSSIEIEAYNQQNVQSLTYYSVIIPTQSGTSAPIVSFTGGNVLTIGSDTLTFTTGAQCIVESSGQTETFNLW